ncbi:aspartate dehydrogenase [Bradyrhizobium guangdongense]|uniref:L-aspartate dehydrogenase n=1 Tax=Bradyrhizobium guangdongense TaxID=1325090 RepID=A0A410V2Z6_9BRAD|nr:aspartate dehydrogenase [Bradyrhizobium guangdongense]QAU38042.1 aspartate dehydrogenase [Bradyrhizobium guangdongense]QOZ59097.1 aspartate dehydrogenase [Bradyrhizobium guangdongense]GGI18997.1 putative L-aspartate dehydrogenase [Bradyrhizobium guangdongense]
MTDQNASSELRVAIAGLGSIGTKVASALDQGIEGLALSALAVRDPAKHQAFLGGLRHPPQILPIDRLGDAADIVVECAPSSQLRGIIEPAVRRGKSAVVVSVGGLLDNYDLVDLARANGGRILVSTGALIGLDAVNAAAIGTIHSVKMVTRKPIDGLKGAPFIVQNNIDIDNLREPLKLFEGSARDAAKGFPANVNVAVALSLAGIGPDRTQIQVWADPTVTRNVHRIEVEADSARFSMSIENIPSENPKTGLITALSVIALLRKQRATLCVGT